jgi:hypothetical protein
MQNGAQNTSPVQGRLLGFVRVVVGGQAFDLPIQAVTFEKDTSDSRQPAGGFFADGAELGILVDEAAPEALVKEQIAQATAEAVRHLSRRFLN